MKLGKIVGRIGHIYTIKRRIGHIYPLRRGSAISGSESKAQNC
jgi:hypothetical protein